MRAFKHNGRLFQILFAALLCASILPNRLLADDKDTSNPPAKAAAAKSDVPKMEAPIPLTERERWLLDRVDHLEKRVEELESKTHPAAIAPADAITLPASVGASIPVAGTVTTAGTVGQLTAGGLNATPARVGVTAVATQASEKGKSAGVPKPQTREPFAFSDCSWLTGN